MWYLAFRSVRQHPEISFKNSRMTSGLVCHICSEFLFEVFAALAQLWTSVQYFGLLCSTLSFQTWSCEQSKMKNIKPRSAKKAFPEPVHGKLTSTCVNILMKTGLTVIPTSLPSNFVNGEAFELGFCQNLSKRFWICLHMTWHTETQLSTDLHNSEMRTNAENAKTFATFLGKRRQ